MMRAEPDGAEVAASNSEASAWPLAPLLVLDRLTAYLDGIGQGSGPIRWERIGEGNSNITFRIQRDGADLVLRRGPRPPLPASTHDMLREARIQGLLGRRGVPVPQILGVCVDESVLGVPFYLMGWLDGHVVTNTIPAELDSPDDRHGMVMAAVDSLVALHSAELDDEIGSLGRPDGYLQRQVERFAALWKVNTSRELPQVAALGDWLLANLPETQRHTVVHGDYRIGNLMFDADAPSRVMAVLDWEMATLGDPLADLGYFTATYANRGELLGPIQLTPVTNGEHFPTSDQIADRYSSSTGLDLGALPWYQCLALWKASIFCEAIYTRYLQGERPGDTFAASLERGVPDLLDNVTLRATSYSL